jgi:hypothetical protein
MYTEFYPRSGGWWLTNSVEDRENVNMRQYLPVQGSTEYANQ